MRVLHSEYMLSEWGLLWDRERKGENVRRRLRKSRLRHAKLESVRKSVM